MKVTLEITTPSHKVVEVRKVLGREPYRQGTDSQLLVDYRHLMDAQLDANALKMIDGVKVEVRRIEA